jgi:hypothetical protein
MVRVLVIEGDAFDPMPRRRERARNRGTERRLRKKLGGAGPSIRTIRGVGYKLD